MVVLILLLLLVISLAAVAAIIYRKLPATMAEWNAALGSQDYGDPFFKVALANLSLIAKDIGVKVATRLVYKLKIASLKTDNFSTGLLQKMRSGQQNGTVPEEEKIEMDRQLSSPITQKPNYKKVLRVVRKHKQTKDQLV